MIDLVAKPAAARFVRYESAMTVADFAAACSVMWPVTVEPHPVEPWVAVMRFKSADPSWTVAPGQWVSPDIGGDLPGGFAVLDHADVQARYMPASFVDGLALIGRGLAVMGGLNAMT